MVKKTKKDEKGPPKDQFDPVLVESSQAATVVLMLESTEEEILLRSTEAIYKFVQKCDANKRLLLDLGSIPLLLKLVRNDNCYIYRNACMALGTLSQLPEVAALLKKSEDAISSMIALLDPDEETLVHEYAALCLSNVAKYFSGVCQIRDQNGLEALVRCLNSPDQDVKNNSIETIRLMLEDYQTRSLVRELHAFPAILELLKSEYPDIQTKALFALQKITEDVDNRSVLRELGALVQFVDFVGTPVYRELHVHAIKILSNCFEDVETIKAIKDNGLLSRLVAIVTDAPPPQLLKQDDKKSKKSFSRAGSRTMKGTDEKSRSKTSLDVVSQSSLTSTAVKEHMSLAIMQAAKNPKIRKLLQEHEVEKMLILFLNHSDAKVQIAASRALRVMAENLLSRECTGRLGGILPLVKMITDKTEDVKEAALTVLSVLTSGNDFNCQEVSKARATTSLLQLLASSRGVAVSNALRTLVNMANEDDLRQEILANNLISALIKPLLSQDLDVQAEAASAVATFILEPKQRQEFVEANAIHPLVVMLDSTSDEVRRNSTKAVAVLAKDTPTAEEICRFGGLDILRNLQTSETKKNAYVDEAVFKLMENNLSAKYAFTGKLCTTDLVLDGFYDVGGIRSRNQFLPLLQYHTQPINSNQPVLLVHAPEKNEETEDILKNPDKCYVKSLDASREQSDVDSNVGDATPKESVDTDSLCLPIRRAARLQLSDDLQLAQYISDVRIILQPYLFCSLRERSILLARFVAEKMGGPIEKGKLVNFSWELQMSQLRYQLKSNVIPIGLVTKGVHYHRALLFKVLGDRVGIPSSLIRGEHSYAWNELYIDGKPMDYHPKYPPKLHIIDLLYEPGRLMPADSPEAAFYTKL